MKRASNTLLTLNPFSSNAMPTALEKPREFVRTAGSPLTPFHNRQDGSSGIPGIRLDMSCLPRSYDRSRLGEGSVRSSLQNLLILLVLISMFVFLRSAQGAEAAANQPGALLQAVRSYVEEATPWKGSEIEIRSIGNFTGSDMPAGEVAYRISQKDPISTFRNMLIPVEICQAGILIRTVWISADIVIRARVVQAATRLRFGSTISQADVKESLTEIADPRGRFFRDCREVVGKVMRRSLAPGEPLTRDYVSNPLVVHSGETVRIRLARGPIALSALARAEQDGRLGDLIRIRNLDFSRPLKAVVIGPGEVKIE